MTYEEKEECNRIEKEMLIEIKKVLEILENKIMEIGGYLVRGEYSNPSCGGISRILIEANFPKSELAVLHEYISQSKKPVPCNP